MGYDYQLSLTAPNGGTRDLTQLVQSISWTGDVKQIARELTVRLVVPRDGSVVLPALEEGAAMTLFQGGAVRFSGQLLQCTTDSQTAVVDLSALDRGRFLVGNQGWYRFDNVFPESAVSALCQDHGIPVAGLAQTGVKVRRKFPGVALDQIISTLYALAGERNGKRYQARFTGGGELEVVEKPDTANLEITQTMGVTNTWSIEDLCNSVAIYTDDGQLVRRMGDDDSQARNGRLEHVVTQRSGEDASSEASAWLEDNGLKQELTVTVLDPPIGLISGTAVLLRDTGSGVSGLFWVDGDTHTWKNGQHSGKFKLNFRNLMNTTTAGSDLT